MEPIDVLFCDQGGIAAGAVVDDQVDLDLVLDGFVHDFSRVLIISGSSIPGTILSNGKALA